MTNPDIPTKTSSLFNVQPTSHTSKHRVFPSLPYTTEILKFIKEFNFQFSDLTYTEYITLCNLLPKYKTCYATHKNDVGKIAATFQIRDKLNTLHKELEKYNLIKQFGSSPQDNLWYNLSKPSHNHT